MILRDLNPKGARSGVGWRKGKTIEGIYENLKLKGNVRSKERVLPRPSFGLRRLSEWVTKWR